MIEIDDATAQEINALRGKIEPLIAELEAIGMEPNAARAETAVAALAYLSPAAEELARVTTHDAAFFRRLVAHMQSEIVRLTGTLLHLGWQPAQKGPPSPPQRSKPFDDGRQPRPMRRRLRGEWLDPPHLPGTFWLH